MNGLAGWPVPYERFMGAIVPMVPNVPAPTYFPATEAVSQCLNFGLSSRANARDLRFLAALEMTEQGKYDVSVLRHSLDAGRIKEGIERLERFDRFELNLLDTLCRASSSAV